MPLTVQCPGCGTPLTAADHLAGRTVRCTQCGQPMHLPAVVDAVAEPPRVTPVRVAPIPAPVASKAEPPPRVSPPIRKRPRRDEPDDIAEREERRSVRRPKRTTRRGFPLWIPVAGGFALLLLLGCGIGAYVALSDDAGGGPLGSVFGDGWVKMEPQATLVAWEFPTEPALGANGIGGGVPDMGENVYGCELKRGGGESIVFTVIVTNHAAVDARFPGQTAHDRARQLRPGQRNAAEEVVRTYQIQGRTAVLVRMPIADKVTLLVTEPGKTYEFTAFGPGVTEAHPDVKRFLDSVRFRDGTGPSASSNPVRDAAKAVPETLPPSWSRVKVNGDTAMTLAMPNPHPAPGVQRAHPDARYRLCTHGRLTTPQNGEIRFRAEFFTETPIDIDPNSLPPDQQPVRRYQVGGHEVWVNRPRDYGDGVTHVPFGAFVENGKVVMCDVSGKGLTLDTPEVKRFIDSMSFTLSPSALPLGR